MSGNKTRPESADPRAYVESVEIEQRRRDGLVLLNLMSEETGLPAVMWGPSIVGFGSYHYKYESGREGDMLIVGFSPRSSAISLYVYGGQESHLDQLARLGKHTTGKSCIYVKKLSDVDLDVIREMVARSFDLASAGSA